MFLTQSGGFIVKPIAKLLGLILSLIYEGLCSLGIVNIGIAIIIFTIFIRLLLFPLTFSQNRSSKISSYIQPEMNKITKKYRNKKDQESMMAQQAEIRQLQSKYGINLGAGCLTSLLQLPIFFALYRVILNVPAYVDRIKDLYLPIAKKISSNEDVFNKLVEFSKEDPTLSSVVKGINIENTDTIIDVLAKFQDSTWSKFSELIPNHQDVVSIMSENSDKINDAYRFFGGINLTTAPGLGISLAMIIPVLSMVFQFLSLHATPQQEPQDAQQAQSMKTMKTFMNIMPIMSFFVCVTVPAGVGLYWAAGALVSFLTSISVNFYFAHCDMEKVLEKSMKKAAKKAAKRKAKGKKSFMEQLQEAAAMQQASQPQQSSNNRSAVNAANTSLKNYSPATNNKQGTKYKAGSLASKANALQNYNNDNNGGKR